MPRKTTDPFQTDDYRRIQQETIMRTVAFLLENGIEFSIAAEVEHLHFEPELPTEISELFAPLSLFVLTGYTYESSSIDEEVLRFEAGFGENNFGSLVSVPLLAIKQIFVGERPILINIAEPAPRAPAIDPSRSMEALLSNPENRKLLKKKKK